ncbi:efflux transporter outer membrane subunit [Geotalea uraniireducens]|uniref:RND efflux system, outer membrane lipoprotein, NodT family n=1 Tax=Geotalea uraniireducens (strain Rf4) TaxID=351605 RepID=A5GCF4_GEOUR|nr:efflux transporter outer membrane subunit [Geotalea uraniireducens]ABQ24740.1 RND efflux system, outer membrane lipoprotein, NodT family [Geotalea uraniireducens Rf4]
MTRLLPVRNAVAAAVAGAALAGCTVGPDFRPPEAPRTDNYTSTALPAQTAAAEGNGGAAQRFAIGREIPGQWWALFHSAALDRLISQAIADSPTLATIQATLRQAQENLRARTGTEYSPSLDANFSAVRQKISGVAFGQPDLANSTFSLFNASVKVSYALDIFGGGRRELEALRSQVDYQRYQLEGAYLALTANIVTTAVKEASLRAQIRATQNILANQEQQLEVVERQFQLGGVARTDVLAQRTRLAQTRATLPPLEKALAQTRHLLAVLAGRFPSDAGLPEFDLDGLQLPQELPVSLPSALVRQRPDIRAAEELMHAAGAQVGVATANLYPQITISGSLGSESGRITDLFGSGTSIWGLGAGLLQPLSHGGELTAKRRAAIAAYDQSAAQYRSTVLQALQNVADVLRALDDDARTLKAQADAETSARDTFDLTRQQFQLGAVNYLSLLDAERQYQQAQISLVQAQAARFADTAALFQALGGGWWNRSAEGGAAPHPPFARPRIENEEK